MTLAEQDAPLQSVSNTLAASGPVSVDPVTTTLVDNEAAPTPADDPQGPIFRFAEPSQILRAHQRDLSQLSRLHNLILDIAHPPTSLRIPFSSAIPTFLHRLSSVLTRGDAIESLSKLVYLGLTFGLASQTIGEEYVDVLPYATRNARFPSLRRRWAVLSVVVGGPIVLRGLIAWLRRSGTDTRGHEGTATQGRAQTLRRSLLAWLSSPVISSLPELWFAWFLLKGRNISWEKGLGGLRYITALPTDSLSSPRPTYEPLGFLMLLPIVTRMIGAWRERAVATRSAQPAVSGRDETGTSARKVGREVSAPRGTSVDISGKEPEPGSQTGNQFQIDGKPIRLQFIGTDEADPEGITSSGPTAASTFDTSLLANNSADTCPSGNEDLRTILPAEAFSHPDRQCPLCLSSRGSIKEASVGGGGTVVTECGHVFCGVCIEEWAVEKMECPLCRQELRLERLIPVYNL